LLICNLYLGNTYPYPDDRDDDGIEDDFDNCPDLANRDQADMDRDSNGDVCDNCPDDSNELQEDLDYDSIGDLCDTDMDGDGVENEIDNCLTTPNPAQGNVDEDAFGNFCDEDIDGDLVENPDDNCPFIANPAQLPEEVVPGCDRDSDSDGVSDTSDNCRLTVNPEQRDTDGDLMGDACDGDMDGDGIPNQADNCEAVPNNGQKDSDLDGTGNDCDAHFCYVVDDASNCLDPDEAFEVYAGADRTVETGEITALTFWANRKNRAIEYKWTMEDRPPGSSASIQDPRGSVTLSTPFDYTYRQGCKPRFTPDRPGVFVIKLSAKLVFPNDMHPDEQLDQYTIRLTAEGEPLSSGGCAQAPGGTGWLGLVAFLPGLAGLRRRRGM
jgi:hypothetical protein